MSSQRRNRRRLSTHSTYARHSSATAPIERRTTTPVELKVTNANSALLTRIGGRAVPYNAPADIGPYVETFAPGAFAESIQRAVNGLPLMLLHDNMRLPIGVSESFQERSDGLHGIWTLDDSDEAQEAAKLAQRGILGYLSVRFAPVRSKVTRPSLTDPGHHATGKDRVHRLEARLLEVSLVSIPAYAEASVTYVRGHGDPPPLSMADWVTELERLRST